MQGVTMTKALSTNTIFLSGPFAENSRLLEDFSSKMYFTSLFYDSLKKHQELQKEYEEALSQDDDELASQMLAEIEMMEGIYKVSFSIFETDEAISS
jgi:hypothetical protein